MYEKAIKNKEKKEFNFEDENNRNCFDYSIQSDEVEIFGSMTPIGTDDYQECYTDFYDLPYNKSEFDKKSKALVKRFLNMKNKKEYEEDSIVYTTEMELYNEYDDEYDVFEWELRLTYCP